ncbi:MAG TPA: 2-oxoglutarate dehydrogenase complex dihydrolipoyllysine-residue succinyltransferase [Desulfuromonadales bacterium]|nr:2-oxoglutarate dehydrogenase complex dihydrolipoyllysine-residue succinyltransferase [Desulfuromonadales bacterium]
MEIKVPEVGESIYEAVVGAWHKKDGEQVAKGDLLCELETDKINLEINAEAAGILSIQAQEGETVKVGSVIATLSETEETKAPAKKAAEPAKETPQPKTQPAAKKAKETPKPPKTPARPAATKATEAPPQPKSPPAAPKTVEPTLPAPSAAASDERVTRRPMSPIRKRIAERLLAVRQQTAMLTTFNEADMSRVMALRKKHKDDFKKKHGVALGYMSFFIKACVEALEEFPAVNSRIDGSDIVEQHFYDIGVAVGSDKGLVVPVVRDAARLHFADIEQTIADYVERIGSNRLNLSDLEGGTFTITNGGVYGSLLSTPILNPPQSAILGMHAIQERPVARDGQVVIRPMMYLALSYDHRIIDGKEAVQFLKRIKEYIEEPEEMLLEL